MCLPLYTRNIETPLGVIRLLGSLDGDVDILLGALADLGDDLASGGVDHAAARSISSRRQWNDRDNSLNGGLVAAVNELAVDEEASVEVDLDGVTLGLKVVGESRRHGYGWNATLGQSRSSRAGTRHSQRCGADDAEDIGEAQWGAYIGWGVMESSDA